MGSTTAAADSRGVLSDPTAVKVLVEVLKTCAAALDTVEVASSSTPSSLPPMSPPAIRMLPASGPGVLVGVAVGVEVVVAVAVAVAVAVRVVVAVAVAVVVAVAVTVDVAVAVAVRVAVAVAVKVAVDVAVEVGVAVAVDVDVRRVDVGVAVAADVEVAVGVALAVGDGAVPNAMPVRSTTWVDLCPLSTKVSFPFSVVPFGLLAEVGLNVTETWQLEFAGTEAPQPFAVMTYGALAVIEVKVTATALELESITVCAAEMVSTSTLPYDREVGDTVGVTMMPTPDRLIVCVGVTALSLTTTFPVLVPVWEGVKMTPKVQVPFAVTWVPLQVSLTVVKSPEGTTLVTLREILLGLVKVIVSAELGTSTGCWPKLTCVGE